MTSVKCVQTEGKVKGGCVEDKEKVTGLLLVIKAGRVSLPLAQHRPFPGHVI